MLYVLLFVLDLIAYTVILCFFIHNFKFKLCYKYLIYNGFKIYWWFNLIEPFFVAVVHMLILYLCYSIVGWKAQ